MNVCQSKNSRNERKSFVHFFDWWINVSLLNYISLFVLFSRFFLLFRGRKPATAKKMQISSLDLWIKIIFTNKFHFNKLDGLQKWPVCGASSSGRFIHARHLAIANRTVSRKSAIYEYKLKFNGKLRAFWFDSFHNETDFFSVFVNGINYTISKEKKNDGKNCVRYQNEETINNVKVTKCPGSDGCRGRDVSRYMENGESSWF
jgi:hypothetical protein